MNAGRILTVEQAAELLQLRAETVRRLLSKGELPGRKIGRKWRIPEQATSHSSAARPPPAASTSPSGAPSLSRPVTPA